jgi:hypothetical protein
MTRLRQFINVNSYYLSVGIGGALILYLLGRDGLTAADLFWLAGYAALCVAVYFGLRTSPARATPAGAVEPALGQGRPTLLEFYSDT